MNPTLEIQIIAIFTALSCALCGSFLLLRKMNMMADSITHTILLGIVLAFFVVNDLSSPFLIIAASIMGVFTVWLIELVNSTKLVSGESSIGVVFPLLFAIAIILISLYSSNIHIDTDSVLLGELAYAPFDRLIIMGKDIGAKSIYVGLVLFIINALFIVLFYKELSLSSFDREYSISIGFSPTIMYYMLMTLVSITTVGSFEAIGSILVIAFMSAPPACGYLLCKKLKNMIMISMLVAIFSVVVGLQAALYFDVSIAGAMATVLGICFALVLLFSKSQGIVGTMLRRQRQRKEFFMDTFMLHVHNHINDDVELGVDSIGHHLNWSKERIKNISKALLRQNYVFVENRRYKLTEKGINSVESLKDRLYPERRK